MILAAGHSKEGTEARVMSDYPNLANAPIQEALVDLRCKLPDGFEVSGFDDLGVKLGESYPDQKPRRVFQAQFGVRGEEAFAATEDAVVDGQLLKSADGKKIAQFRLDGFTYNWLRPYESWKSLRQEAMSRWEDYLSVVTPEEVTRIALRYVNRFSIELPTELNTVLRVPPELPPEIPSRIAQFLFRWVVDDPETNARCHITQSSEDSKKANCTDIILDIDCFVIGTPGFPLEDLWGHLDELRVLKNRIFFNSLTPKALELFK